MAQVTTVQLIDDIDGTEAEETVPFSIDGRNFEIDLNKKNADKLRKALDPFMKAGRSSGRARSTGGAPRAKTDRGYSLPQLREWAAKNGVEIPPRGRIKQDVVDAYLAAGGK